MTPMHDPPLILVADDQMPTAVMLERVFEFEGYHVEKVYDGEAAVEAASTMLPDLILLDIQMPKKNGFEVLKILRESQHTAEIPTILITAMGEFKDVVHGLQLGADDYLRKPFHPQELLARAKSKIRESELKGDLRRRTQELEALLRVSEELSQHLEMEVLLDFVLFLIIDLIPCQVAAIYRVDDGHIADGRIRNKDGSVVEQPINLDDAIQWILQTNQPTLWPTENHISVENYKSGIIIPLQYGNTISGILTVLNDQNYDTSHMRLLHGIARQTALALRNAELYEIQANYALHLQDMVAERTAELESAQEMLIRSEKLASVGRLAASVAHEIKNPLFPIQINLDDMLEDLRDSRPIHIEDIERTLESVHRIRHIVENLLEFTGKRHSGITEFQPINVNGIINSIIELNRKVFEQEDIGINLEVDELPYVLGNKYQLEQVLMNLILNARDAMQRYDTLTIRAFAENDQVIVHVEDTGSGIAAEVIDNIFEPFISTKEHGSGLGLFISYGIIQNHKGEIEVASEVGTGTRFTLTLPTSSVAEH